MLNNNHIKQAQAILMRRRVFVYLLVLEYLRRKMILEAFVGLTGVLFKNSSEAVIPASFPPASYTYNAIGNITSKVSGPTTLGYTYHPTKKHAVSSITVNGTPYSFGYDNNGNMQTSSDLTNPASIVPRSMTWNADNMPLKVTRNGISTTLAYDGESRRVKKVGPSGTTYYIGDHFEVINGDPTKYIFAGNLRVAKVSSATGKYYFHKDHLGSSSAMTSDAGSVQEETNYMPFGEQREHTGLTLTNYKFTDQELDPETGLYNYGARYYDPVVSMWVSPDPVLLKYFPDSNEPDKALPGLGGIYNPRNLGLYSYAHNNPLKYIDPNGAYVYLYFWTSAQTSSGVGHVSIGIGDISRQTFYDAYPSDSGAANSPMELPFRTTGSMGEVLSNAHNTLSPALILQFNTTAAQDSRALQRIDSLLADKNNEWRLFLSNCADVSKTGIRGAGFFAGASPLSTPMQLSQALWTNYSYGRDGKGPLSVFSGDWEGYNSTPGSLWGGTINYVTPLWNSLQQSLFPPTNASAPTSGDSGGFVFDW